MVMKNNSTGANLGFEDKIWKAADKLRNNMDAAEYKHVVLGFDLSEVYFGCVNDLHERLSLKLEVRTLKILMSIGRRMCFGFRKKRGGVSTEECEAT